MVDVKMAQSVLARWKKRLWNYARSWWVLKLQPVRVQIETCLYERVWTGEKGQKSGDVASSNTLSLKLSLRLGWNWNYKGTLRDGMSLNLLPVQGKKSIVRCARVSKGKEERKEVGGCCSFIYPFSLSLSLSLRLVRKWKCKMFTFSFGRNIPIANFIFCLYIH